MVITARPACALTCDGSAAVKIGRGPHEGLGRRNRGGAGHTARCGEAGGDIHDGGHRDRR
eukprot:1182847-Prorocentrum_minimum.AAC.4